MQSLCNAARRGVDVRITIPPRGDRGILTPLASKSYMQEALEAGVHFYFYGKGYMHSKIMACDDRIATVGSTNIDPRSFLLDLEINLVVEDRAFTREIKEICLADEKDSECITMEKWQQRPILQRVMERMARIFSAQL
jgi:cardiolipin synthase